MITITIYGLDPFTFARYSKENTDNIASLFETDPDEIVFIGSDSAVLHKGIEQTSWNTIIKVDAPEKYEPFEKVVADYFSKTIPTFSINLNVEFTYFHEHHAYEFVNKTYPRFIREENLVNFHTHDHDHDEEDDEDYEEEHDDSEEIFDGNIFEEFNKRH